MDFSFNDLTAKSTKILGKLLESSIKLESLNLQYNFLGVEGCHNILDSLTLAREEEEGSSSLVYLNLEGNDVKTQGLLGINPDQKLFDNEKSKIEKFMLGNKDLIELNLSNNKIDEFGIIETVSQFNSSMNPTSLEVLNLDNPFVGSTGQTTSFHIGRMLQSNDTLQKLSLRKSNLNDDGIKII